VCHRGEDPDRSKQQRRIEQSEEDNRRRAELDRRTEIVDVVGAILIGVALYQGYEGVSKKFLDDSKIREMSRE
jgi:hypothetical protein